MQPEHSTQYKRRLYVNASEWKEGQTPVGKAGASSGGIEATRGLLSAGRMGSGGHRDGRFVSRYVYLDMLQVPWEKASEQIK